MKMAFDGMLQIYHFPCTCVGSGRKGVIKQVPFQNQKPIAQPRHSGRPRGCRVLLQRFANLDVPLEYVGQQFREVHTLLLGLGGKVLPHTLLDGSGQKTFAFEGMWCRPRTPLPKSTSSGI